MAPQHDPSIEALGWSLLEAAPEAILVVREDGTVARANRRAERLFGFDRGELDGAALDGLLLDDGRREGEVVPEKSGPYPALRATRRLQDRAGRKRDGRTFPIEVSQSSFEHADGSLRILVVRDVSERRRLETHLRRMSTRDALTGLYNRAYFEQERARLDRAGTFPCSVIVADVDGLKPVNDLVGHAAGDALLRRTGAILRGAFRDADVVARTGGDEFVVLLPGVGPHELALAVERVRGDLVRHNGMHPGHELGISIGAATAFAPGELRQALVTADHRMYEEKRSHAGRSVGTATE